VSTPEHAFSGGFVEVARAEADRLKLQAEQLRAEAAQHVDAAERLTAEALELEHRARELDELLGRAPQLRLDLPGEGLRGNKLREAAIGVLARRHGIGEPIHYRRWFELLLSEGVSVSGKDPLATFLTQVTRSPLVEREPGAAGVYRLDLQSAADRALSAYKQAELELRRAEDAYRRAVEGAREAGAEASLPEVGKLHRRLREAQRRLASAERTLAEVARAEAVLGAR
jgi:DNA repair exonuclease SbcCD ATPase subunit